jgi:hypothetical protein
VYIERAVKRTLVLLIRLFITTAFQTVRGLINYTQEEIDSFRALPLNARILQERVYNNRTNGYSYIASALEAISNRPPYFSFDRRIQTRRLYYRRDDPYAYCDNADLLLLNPGVSYRTLSQAFPDNAIQPTQHRPLAQLPQFDHALHRFQFEGEVDDNGTIQQQQQQINDGNQTGNNNKNTTVPAVLNKSPSPAPQQRRQQQNVDDNQTGDNNKNTVPAVLKTVHHLLNNNSSNKMLMIISLIITMKILLLL